MYKCSIFKNFLIITLFLWTGFYHVLFASPIFLYQSNHIEFTQQNANELIQLGEFLAGSHFTSADKKALQVWSIKDFKSAPKAGVVFYKHLAKIILPKIQSSKKTMQASENYRMSLYLDFLNLFERHPEYSPSPNNFLAIVDRYHPPKATFNETISETTV